MPGILSRPRPIAPRRQTPSREAHPDAVPTGLPNAPCFMCGARGWCDHRKDHTI